MKKNFFLFTSCVLLLCACNNSKEKASKNEEDNTEQKSKKKPVYDEEENLSEIDDGPQSTPASVVKAIFKAAKTGDYSNLSNLCDPRGDEDSKMICGINSETAEKQEEFQSYFSKGRIVGEPEIEGDEAAVKIKFGPDGDKDETMNLRKTGHQWYLVSF